MIEFIKFRLLLQTKKKRMSFNKFLDFFGLGDSNNFPMNEDKREK